MTEIKETNMARTPRAADTLLRQVQEKYKTAKFETVGDPDGLGVHRTVRFNKGSSKWLVDTLPLTDDTRIERVEMKSGQAHVTFTHTTLADTRHRFPLDAADLYRTVTAEGDLPTASQDYTGDDAQEEGES